MTEKDADIFLLSLAGITKDYKEEWGWHRYLLNEKMVAAICRDKAGELILTVKCEPSFGAHLREVYEDVIPGYYMNKTHWNSVKLKRNVPSEVIKAMISQSYELIYRSFSRKIQSEIEKAEDA